MQDLLSTVRHMCSELVSVSKPDRKGHWRTAPANLEEIGEWSAAVLAETPVRRGSPIRITCEGGKQLNGVVKSCERVDLLGFWTEIGLAPNSRWSEQLFTPKHLLKLTRQSAPQTIPLRAASGY
jgi:hypothetical protein